MRGAAPFFIRAAIKVGGSGVGDRIWEGKALLSFYFFHSNQYGKKPPCFWGPTPGTEEDFGRCTKARSVGRITELSEEAR